MSARDAQLGRPVRLAVRLVDGETTELVARLVLQPGAGVVRVLLPPAPTSDPREAAARRIVQHIDAALARRDAPSLEQIEREADLVIDLVHQLQDAADRMEPGA